MPIVAPPPNKDKKFELPEAGVQYLAVLADIINLGIVQTKKGPQPRVRFIWLLEEKDSTGKHMSVQETFHLSGHPDSLLSKRTKSMFGRVPPEDYDNEKSRGVCRVLVLEHNTVGDRTFANIAAVLKVPHGTTPFRIPADYVRKQQR